MLLRPPKRALMTPPRTAAGLGACALFGAALLTVGCSSGPSRPTASTSPDGGNAESVLTLLMPFSPQDAVAMATDPYDADARFRGITLMANASYGSDDLLIEAYLLALSDEDAAVRGAAIRALARHGGPEHVQAILPLADDPDAALRWDVAIALQKLHDARAVDTLMGMVSSDEDAADVRVAAARALGQYRQRRVLDALIAALDDNDLAVSAAASESLATLTGFDLGTDVRDWLAWSEDEAAPFANAQPYTHPGFVRNRFWHEYITFWDKVPSEEPGPPAGLPVEMR